MKSFLLRLAYENVTNPLIPWFSRLSLSLLVTLAGTAFSQRVSAQVPGIINPLVFVQVDGIPFDGQGFFKFALVDALGTTTFWSHDATSVAGGPPTSRITNDVVRGRFSIALGDTTIPNMTQTISASVFANTGVYLRI